MAARERQIIDAAAKLFYKRGFHNVGMDDIGREVGVTGPAIYRHFSGKDEILATLLNEAIDEIVRRTLPDEDPHVELDHLLRAQSDFAVAHAELVSVYTRDDRELRDPWRSQFQRRARRHEEYWIDLLRRCYPEVSEQQVTWAAHIAMGMIHSVARWRPPASKGDGSADLISSMVRHALLTLEEEAALVRSGGNGRGAVETASVDANAG